jgi:hypothetical protein
MADTRSSQPSLTVLGGALSGTRFVLEASVDEILVGSDPSCGFHIPSPGVSPLHARLWIDAEGVAVYDTNSPRGVYVNDDRVQGRAMLRNGDILWLGPPGDPEGVMLQCRIPARPAAPAPPTPPPAPVEVAPIEEEGIVVAPAAAEPEPVFEMVTDTEAVPAEPEFAPTPDETVVYTPAEAIEAETVIQPRYEEETTHFTAGPAPEPTPPAQVPAFFEEDIEETVADIPSPVAAPPPSVPPQEAKGETFVMAAPDEEFDATTPLDLSAPTPPPPPAAKAAPPARPAPPAEAPRRAPAPRPAPQPHRPSAPPAGAVPAAPSAAPKKSGAPVALVFGGIAAALVVLAVGGYLAYVMFLKPAPPAPTAAPTTIAVAPTPTPESPMTPSPEPQVEATPTPAPPTPEPAAATPTPPMATPTPRVSPSPSPKASPSPSPTPRRGATPTPPPAAATPTPDQVRAQQQAQQVATLTQQGDSALAARQYDAAIGHYDQVLRLEPGNARASEARTRAIAARDAAKRTFVSGRTNVQAAKAEKGGVSGFDTDDVSVAKAPDFTGRLEFEMSPTSAKPGDAYVLKIYLVNEGKKSIKITGVNITRTVNGTASGQPVAPSSREAQPRQRVLLAELPGAWPENVNSWSTEVVMTANKGDSLTNRLTWR